jgi:hypothetical protein
MLLLRRLGFLRQLADDVLIQHVPRVLRMNGAELIRRVLACAVQPVTHHNRLDEIAAALFFAAIDG